MFYTPKRWEYGCRVLYAGDPSFFCCGISDGNLFQLLVLYMIFGSQVEFVSMGKGP